MTGGIPISRSTYGRAPTWFSWPWVITIASIRSARSRRIEKSGRTRSIPSMSAVGNISPVSTITIRPSTSTAVMFLPISPRPPSGRIRTFEAKLGGRRGQKALRLERLADRCSLLVVGLDDRQAGPRRADAEQLQGRLHRDRVGHAEHLVERPKLLVDRLGA